MASWEDICPVADIPPGSSKSFPLAALDILIVHSGKHFYACANECPVDSCGLDEGEVHGHVIVCPEGGCKLDLSNGKCLTEPDSEIPTFPVEVRDGNIWVKF